MLMKHFISPENHSIHRVLVSWNREFQTAIFYARYVFLEKTLILKPPIAAMHGQQSVFDIGHCTIIHCDAEGVSLVDQ